MTHRGISFFGALFGLAGVLLLGLFSFTPDVQAAETQPGDACGTVGLFRQAGGPEETDGQFLVCDGTAWVDFISWTTSGQVGVSTTSVPSTMTFIANGSMGAVEYCDENGGDCFVASDVGAAGGLWSASGTSVYYNSGNVGIGTNDPTSPLEIRYAGGSGDTDPARIDVINTTNDGSAWLGLWEVYNDYGFTLRYDSDAGGSVNEFQIYRHAGSPAGTEVLRIDRSTGNTIFSNDLTASNIRSTNLSSPVITVASSDDGDAAILRLLESGDTTSDGVELIYDGNANKFHIKTGTSGTYTERMTFLRDSLGVGIGITSPNVSLDVSGSIEYTGTIQDVSDRRLKQNIAVLPSQLENMMQLEAVSFEMKDAPGVIEYGLIAQDAEQVYPLLVGTADDEMGTKSMNYVGLIAPMLKAMQEQQAQIEALKARIEVLETR